ncbi:hypothetical protein FF80_00874 [Devosia sp. LC5]|uniref:hypothetical protein n=1 Tax=Devosia sp. LC5 TaxID=1502724 RepID=UPI0004E35018|nr:hypothetical protein [Devosia sp. LC5]KFC70602.1 hypothetical protein FF80_00874 [Devosia sp. LC5]
MNNTTTNFTLSVLAAAVLSAIIAALHTFLLTPLTIDALMAGDTIAKAQQGLRMMWYGMSAIAWTYPIVLLSLTIMRPSATRAMLGLIASFNVAQAMFYLTASLWIDPSSYVVLMLCVLHAAAGALVLYARPPYQAGEPVAPRRGGYRLVLFCMALAIAAPNAVYHTVFATLYGWPAELLASNTPPAPKQMLYAMWLFSCVLFTSIPAALLWSLRAPAAAGRFVLRYLALLIATLMVSWGSAMALGIGPELLPSGPISLGLLVALTALSAPPSKKIGKLGRIH